MDRGPSYNAGVFVRASGLEGQPSIVAADGTLTDGPFPEAIGGVTIVDVPSREEAPRSYSGVACWSCSARCLMAWLRASKLALVRLMDLADIRASRPR
jgi:hypothetical protein